LADRYYYEDGILYLNLNEVLNLHDALKLIVENLEGETNNAKENSLHETMAALIKILS